MILKVSLRLSRTLLQFVLLLILTLDYGCGGKDDIKQVDFTKTMPVAQSGDQPAGNDSLRVAVASMITPRETFFIYRQVLNYISSHLGQQIELYQRKTYSEVNELLGKGEIDLAFICSGPYIAGKEKYDLEMLAAPQVRGSHFYRSYLIVKADSSFRSLEDLRGRTFAFTDPDSNTGKLVPTYWLMQAGERPETFFSDTIYTFSHDNSILAVSRGLVDGAAIHGLIWDYYQSKDPTHTSRTRIIKKSVPYGIPPLVTSRKLSAERKKRLREVLFAMHRESEGQAVLAGLMIDRFVPPREEWYDSIRQMKQALARR
jgi:phosphonate transport system substrate-binding protein